MGIPLGPSPTTAPGDPAMNSHVGMLLGFVAIDGWTDEAEGAEDDEVTGGHGRGEAAAAAAASRAAQRAQHRASRAQQTHAPRDDVLRSAATCWFVGRRPPLSD